MNLSATAIATLTSIATLATQKGASVKTSTLSATGYDIKQLYGTIPSLVKKGLVVKSETDKVRYIALTELGYQVLDKIQNPVVEVETTQTEAVVA